MFVKANIMAGEVEEATWCKSFSAPNVKVIGQGSFQGASNLETIHFASATHIQEDAFMSSDIVSIYFPNVIQIDADAFVGC